MKRNSKVVLSIEARMGSSRLPGKVLMDLFNKPAIECLVDRVRCCKTVDEIIIATTTSPADDILVDWCNSYNVRFYRGSEDNVLQRVVNATKGLNADIIVEITGDCPFTDPHIIDLGVETFFNNDCDYLTNCEVPSFPQGICVQVFRYSDLALINQNTCDPAVREHVSLLFYEQKNIYKNINLLAPAEYLLPDDCRFQLDYPEDLSFLRQVCLKLVPLFGYTFTLRQLVDFLRENPQLININRFCEERLPR